MWTIREKAAQLIFARIGSNMPPPVTVAEDVDRIRSLLDRCPLGGLILFNGDLESTPSVITSLQQSCASPLLIGADLERGAGQQLAGATLFPHAMAYGQLGEKAEELAFESARLTALEAQLAGVHVLFAPVADVNRDPRNPIISTRSFGSDPKSVSGLVQAVIHGIHAGGLLATAKHFPGHGNTRDDSHATLPVVTGSKEELKTFDLVPFEAAIQAGSELIMTAHVSYPSLDETGGPATASSRILGSLLRDEMGFDGAVITDSLLMGAIHSLYQDPGDLAVALIQAGVDILLDPRDPELMVDGIVRAVESGKLPERKLDAAFGRVASLKARFDGKETEPVVDQKKRDRISLQSQALARTVAQGSVSLLKTHSTPLKFDRNGMLFLMIRSFRTHLDPPGSPLQKDLEDRIGGISFVEVDPETDRRRLDEIRTMARSRDLVVASLIVRPAAWRTFGLPAVQAEFVHALTQENQVVLVSLGSPFVLEEYPEATEWICSYSDVPASQWAVAEMLTERYIR